LTPELLRSVNANVELASLLADMAEIGTRSRREQSQL
jgi:hypothetical protein